VDPRRQGSPEHDPEDHRVHRGDDAIPSRDHPGGTSLAPGPSAIETNVTQYGDRQ
jgi:hypothetical protein